MKTAPKSRQGFTLIELMIVVAIIGILTAISLPQYRYFQYEARRAELPPSVSAIQTSLFAYDATFDMYPPSSGGFFPRTVPDKLQVPWVSGTNFDLLAWRPDGAVRGIYQFETDGETYFTVTGECDVDSDGVRARFISTESFHTYNETGHQVF